MARVILLDSGPLGLLCMPETKPAAAACRAWARGLAAAGAAVTVPAVADYEVRRELYRAGFDAAISRLNALRGQLPFLPVSEPAWEYAAAFWALLRNTGAATSGPQDLDADAIIAGQAVAAGGPGNVVTIATTNVRHLVRFPGVDARPWASVT